MDIEKCCSCNGSFFYGGRTRKVGLTSKLPAVDIPVSEGLRVLFPGINITKDEIRKLSICCPCATAVGVTVKKLWNFLEATNPDSPIRRWLPPTYLISGSPPAEITLPQSNIPDAEHEVPLSVTKIPTKADYIKFADKSTQTRKAFTQKTSIKNSPVRKTILNAMGNPVDKSTFLNTLRKITHDEMHKLLKVTSFRGTLTKELTIPSITTVHMECQENCPTLLAMLHGMFGRKERFKGFTSVMRSTIGMAVQHRRRDASLFQKINSMILWKTNASKNTYALFKEMGISTSYTVTLATLDKLCKDFVKKEELNMWRNDISDEMKQYDECIQLEGDLSEDVDTTLSNISGPNHKRIRLDRNETNISEEGPKSPPFSNLEIQEQTPQLIVVSGEPQGSKRKLNLASTDGPIQSSTIRNDNLNKCVGSQDHNSMINVDSALVIQNRVQIAASKFKPKLQGTQDPLPAVIKFH